MLASLSLLALATSALAANFTVQVGQGGLVYVPDEVTAAVGDTVNFVFSGTTHTVTQSTFASPCTNAGFDSGFAPGAGAVYSVLVNNTRPLWVYCKPHCSKGMVMAINANDTSANSFTAFKAAAMGGAVASGSSVASGSATTGVGSASSTIAQATSTTKASAGLMSVEKLGMGSALLAVTIALASLL